MTEPPPGPGGAGGGPGSGTRDGARVRPRWRLRAFVAAVNVLAAAMDLAATLRSARRGPWRVEVLEESMTPGIVPGDWLLVDPTCRRWPRPGSVVVLREPGSGLLVVKRVAARGPAAPAFLPASLPSRRAAWVLGDAPDRSVDSRVYGPVDLDALVGRAWFRYGPPARAGRLRARSGPQRAHLPSDARKAR